MKRSLFHALALLLILGGIFTITAQAQSPDTSPPKIGTVKLIFIHHSTGENWLTDDYGNLGRELYYNNYYVSDTNYGWGPDSIGDRTDIINWREWFRSSETPRYMEALFSEIGQNSHYERGFGDPGGENQIVMFKSCFPNSALSGSPDDPPDPNEDFTVGHAKYVYNDLLNYFSTRPDKLFIVITAPPLQDATYADNARGFNNWLVYDWLDENNYALNNVAVFDFYNVLTHPDNHHRVNSGQIEHSSNGSNTLYYDSHGDDHPNEAGSQKATAEFIPLLNYYYHRWAEDAPAVQPSPEEAPAPSEEDQPPLESDAVPEEESPPSDSSAPNHLPLDLIDNFDSTPPPGTDGWQPYWDTSTPTEFDCTLKDGALRIDFDVAAESWATCTLFYDDYQDWSQFEGVAFNYRADALGRIVDVTVHGGTLNESTSYQYTVETIPGSDEEWIPMVLTWNQILGVDWEADTRNPIDPSQITGIAFGFGAYEGTSISGTIWVDDLRLLGDESAPVMVSTPDEAESPTEEQLAEDSSSQPQTEPETPPQGGGGLCANSVAVGVMASVGVIKYRRKNSKKE